MPLTIIGDVHQKYGQYRDTCSQYDYTLQLGDLGFHYETGVDTNCHKAFFGNHDNYHLANYYKGNIGDYGRCTHGGIPFFFVRGAFSIDVLYRQSSYLNGGKQTWWHQEELTLKESLDCIKKYKRAKPDIMITHSCPISIVKKIGNIKTMKKFGWDDYQTRTSQLLEHLFEIHQPLTWIFGHFHKDWECELNGTKFICLDELSTYTLGG